ncbi:MAG: HyaD/HybD family hydrogenase maturation endopeptidase [Candidatus Brocadiaceae bacterium]|nr:HyaD/HybD family hydrogenase maturation endopeptidase [Candidatus Brocadiaceae bacterium]
MSEKNTTIIIGIGNLLLMDEGIGVHVAHELEKHRLPQDVRIIDGGTGGLKLLDLLYGANTVIFIDAVENGKAPGTITTFKLNEVCSVLQDRRYSLHETHLRDVIHMAAILDNPPEIKIIGIQPKTVKYEMELSQELRNAMPDIINHVFKEIQETHGMPSA